MDNIKWLPKFLIIKKQTKSAYLYDEEEIAQETDANSLRIDTDIKKEAFITQWRNKSEKFDLNYSIKTEHHFQHHLSNKDIESLDKESLNSYDNEHNATTTAANSTFRFAGFFFKRDKSEKIKHSTLKRAKSGIQLERKKQSLLNNESLMKVKPQYENRNR